MQARYLVSFPYVSLQSLFRVQFEPATEQRTVIDDKCKMTLQISYCHKCNMINAITDREVYGQG